MHHRLFWAVGWVLLFPLFSFGQDEEPKVTTIELLGANDLFFEGDAQRLIGNVRFRHDSATMFCDSAYLFKSTNELHAFGRVHIEQGDTLDLYGDTLYYEGTKKLARMRGNIRMMNPDATLTTDYLDYDRARGMGYYLGGGVLVNRKENNTLTSEIGYYYPSDRAFFFKDSVKLVNPDYTIESDTLKYNSDTEVSSFFGPTWIRNKTDVIYCEAGWYDTRNNQSEFRKNAYVESKNQRLGGDSLVYDREIGIGEAFGNVSILDTSENFQVFGEYAINYEKDSVAIVTGKAMLVQEFGEDSLFLHADTLYSAFDSTRKHRLIHAYHHAKFFKSDMQGKCDSLVFSDVDSTITLFRDPILWSEENQITADSITIFSFDGKIESMEMTRNAMIISEEDSTMYNQIKGKDMTGYFTESRLSKVDVRSNGQTIYYAKDDKKDEIIGVNKAVCSDLTIYIDSNQVQRIKFLTQPNSTLYPLSKAPQAELVLKGFVWHHDIRPLRQEDIFYWDGRAPEDTLVPDTTAFDSTAADTAGTAYPAGDAAAPGTNSTNDQDGDSETPDTDTPPSDGVKKKKKGKKKKLKD